MKKLILIALMTFATTANAAEGFITDMCPEVKTLTMALYDLSHAAYNEYNYQNGQYSVATIVASIDDMGFDRGVEDVLKNLTVSTSKLVWEHRNDFSRLEMGLIMEQACEKVRAQ